MGVAQQAVQPREQVTEVTLLGKKRKMGPLCAGCGVVFIRDGAQAGMVSKFVRCAGFLRRPGL